MLKQRKLGDLRECKDSKVCLALSPFSCRFLCLVLFAVCLFVSCFDKRLLDHVCSYPISFLAFTVQACAAMGCLQLFDSTGQLATGRCFLALCGNPSNCLPANNICLISIPNFNFHRHLFFSALISFTHPFCRIFFLAYGLIRYGQAASSPSRPCRRCDWQNFHDFVAVTTLIRPPGKHSCYHSIIMYLFVIHRNISSCIVIHRPCMWRSGCVPQRRDGLRGRCRPAGRRRRRARQSRAQACCGPLGIVSLFSWLAMLSPMSVYPNMKLDTKNNCSRLFSHRELFLRCHPTECVLHRLASVIDTTH